MQQQESKRSYSSPNYINVMCCISRVFTKKAVPLLSLTSHFYWLHNSGGWSSVWALLQTCVEPEGRSAACACVWSTVGYWGGISLRKAFLFTPTNLQGAFSICSVCSLWKTSDSFFNQSQMRQCESVCAWARQCEPVSAREIWENICCL